MKKYVMTLLLCLLPAEVDGQDVAHRHLGKDGVVIAASPDDVRRGVSVLARSAEAFRRSVGADPPRMAVVLERAGAAGLRATADSLTQEGFSVFSWRLPAPVQGGEGGSDAEQRLRSAMQRLRDNSSTIQHEICHAMIHAHAGSSPSAEGADGRHYGHPAVPDWAEESIAISCEDEAQLERRRAHFRENTASRIPLPEFLSMTHPALSGSEGESPRANEQVSAESAATRLIQSSDPRSAIFYSQALSFGEFLSRCRPGMLLEFATMVGRAQPVDELLRACGLPTRMEDLERDWPRLARARQF